MLLVSPPMYRLAIWLLVMTEKLVALPPILTKPNWPGMPETASGGTEATMVPPV